MIVACDKCSTKFKIADEKVTAGGVKVRCSKCRYMFLVKPDGQTQPVVEDQPQGAKEPAAVARKSEDPPPVSDGIPDDIFSATTRVVSPPPDLARPRGDGKFPVPAPAVPAPLGGGKSLADQVDLDADDGQAAGGTAPPLADMPTSKVKAPVRPPPPPPPPSKPPPGDKPAKPGPEEDFELGDDLFGEGPLPPPSAIIGTPPGTSAPPAAKEKKPAAPPAAPAGPTGATGAKASPPPVPPATPAEPTEEKASPPPAPSATPARPTEAKASPPPAPPAKNAVPPSTPGTGALEDPFADLDLSAELPAELSGPQAPTVEKPPPRPPAVPAAATGPAATPPPVQAKPAQVPAKPAQVPAKPAQVPAKPAQVPATPAPDAADAQPTVEKAPPAQPPASAPAAAGAPAAGLDDPFADLDITTGTATMPVETGTRQQPGPPPAPTSAPPGGEDPFAGIDLDVPPAAPVPDGDPFADIDVEAPASPDAGLPGPGAPAATPTDDLFGDLGDPFAGLDADKAQGEPEPAPAKTADLASEPGGDPWQVPEPSTGPDPFAAEEPGPSAGAPPPLPQPGGGDDPFAGIESSDGSGGGDMEAALMGNDPFGGMSTSATTGANEAPSGLELDQDGKLTGEEPPPPPPPSRSATGLAQQPEAAEAVQAPVRAPPPPMAAAAPEQGPAGGMWLYKIGFGFLMLVVLLLLFVTWRSDGKPDFTTWSTYVEAFTGRSSAETVAGDLQAVRVNNTAYPNREGHPLVVVWGEVKNETDQARKNLQVTGKIVDDRDRELASFTAPAGISFDPIDMVGMLDEQAVVAAYRQRLAGVGDLEVGPGESVEFMLVFYEHPVEMTGLRFLLIPAESDDPLRGLPPAPEPAVDEAAAEENEEKAEQGDEQVAPPASRPRVRRKGDVIRLRRGPPGTARPES